MLTVHKNHILRCVPRGTILLLVFLSVSNLHAVLTGTNAFDLQVVATATNSGTAFQIVNVNVPQRVFLVQHSGITGQVNSVSGTNSLKVNVQMSFDGSNWTTLRTYIPPRTNSTVDSFAPDLSAASAYMRVQVATTNTITVGVSAIKP